MHFEVDIIARQKNCIHFVEVKTRSNYAFGFPEQSVDARKMTSLKKAAEAYMYQMKHEHLWVQFDIMAIVIKGQKTSPIIDFFEDVF